MDQALWQECYKIAERRLKGTLRWNLDSYYNYGQQNMLDVNNLAVDLYNQRIAATNCSAED